MISIKSIGSRQLHRLGLDEQVIQFDKQNMGPILAQAGVPFPEEKRRKGFGVDGTFHIAFDEQQHIVGYLEYCPDWNDERAIYISSLQISAHHRNGRLFQRLVAIAIADLRRKTFTVIMSNVQKNNAVALRIYRNLRFSICENESSQTSYSVRADRSILEAPLATKLMPKAQQPHSADADKPRR